MWVKVNVLRTIGRNRGEGFITRSGNQILTKHITLLCWNRVNTDVKVKHLWNGKSQTVHRDKMWAVHSRVAIFSGCWRISTGLVGILCDFSKDTFLMKITYGKYGMIKVELKWSQSCEKVNTDRKCICLEGHLVNHQIKMETAHSESPL